MICPASYLIQGREINLMVSTVFVAGGSLGCIIGAFYARRIDQLWLRRIFSVFIIMIGLTIFIENLIKIL